MSYIGAILPVKKITLEENKMGRKIKKPQTIIGFGEIIIGLSYFLTELFSGGFGISWPFSVCQWLSIVGIFTGAALVTWGLLQDEVHLDLVKLKYSKLYGIMPILQKMHQYLWDQAEGQQILNIDIENFNKTGEKINRILGVTTGNLDQNKPISEMIEDTKKIVEMEEEQLNTIISESSVQRTLDFVKKNTKLLDADGYGLKIEKESNKYKKYLKKIDNYYNSNKELIDLKLQYLINNHILASEFFANGLLVLKRVDLITQKTNIPNKEEFLSPTIQANIEGIKNETDTRLNEIRIMISEYVGKLEKKEQHRASVSDVANLRKNKSKSKRI
jgi:hypothetical protein